MATVVEANTPLDDDGLLRQNRIRKFHEVTFDAGRSLAVVLSPEGDAFVRISRDLNRTSDVPTMPAAWQQLEIATSSELVIRLPDETLNLRADNEDSFQGPVPQLDALIP